MTGWTNRVYLFISIARQFKLGSTSDDDPSSDTNSIHMFYKSSKAFLHEDYKISSLRRQRLTCWLAKQS
jgi:hypothetical protein